MTLEIAGFLALMFSSFILEYRTMDKVEASSNPELLLSRLRIYIYSVTCQPAVGVRGRGCATMRC
jgi:hypothetical protein